MARLSQILFFFSIPVALIWYLVKYGLSHVYDVEFDESGIVFILFGYIRVGRLHFVSIKQAYDRGAFLSSHNIATCMFGVFPFVNRIPRDGNPIIIEKRRGLIKYFSLTPESPDIFLRTLKNNLTQRRLGSGLTT